MPDFAVSTAFNASGNIVNNLGKMDKGVKRFGDSATTAFRKASRSGSQFGSIVKGIIVTDILKGGLRALTNGVRASAVEFVNYDQAITSATAKFKGLNIETDKGKKSLQSLKNIAREVGAATEFSATQAAGGLDFLATAGINAKNAIILLPGVVDLATVADLELARATDIMTDSLGAFGLATKNSDELLKQSTRVNDVFAKTLTSSNQTLENLFEAVGKGAATFTESGQTLETFATLTSIMADATVKGAEAGTSIRNVMLRLAGPSKEAGKLLKDLGVKVQDGNGNFFDMFDILEDLENGLKGMGTAQRTAALDTLFGARSVTGINILLKKGTKSLREYRTGLIESGGESKRMADIMRGSIGNQLKALQSSASELGFKFIDTFKDKIGPAIKSLTEIIRNINVPALIDNFKSLVEIGLQFRGVLFGMTAGWVAFKVAMGAAALVQGIQAFILFATTLRAAAAAQGLLNAVMALNPIGLIVIAVGALVAAFFLLVDNFDIVKDLFIKGLKIMFAPLLLLIEGVKRVAAFAGSFFGSDEEAQVTARVAPNQTKLAAQEIRVNGQISLSGAPDGTTFNSGSGSAPEIRMSIAGVNQ